MDVDGNDHERSSADHRGGGRLPHLSHQLLSSRLSFSLASHCHRRSLPSLVICSKSERLLVQARALEHS